MRRWTDPKIIGRALLPAVGALALIAAFIWQVRSLGNIRVDDAYITFSFSKNLALGNGPTYSHGLRVEGYSNFLWMLLVAAPLALRSTLDPYLLARVLTVPFAVLLGWAVHALIRGETKESNLLRALAWLALLLMVFDTDLVVAAICGLETLPYVALLVAGFALYQRGKAGSEWARRLTIPCLVAVALMRIDGFAPLLFVLAWELGSSLAERRFRFDVFLRWFGPGVAVYMIWFIWRCAYYGLPLPTTYYAKALIPSALPDRGYEYVRDFWISTGLFLTIPFAALAVWRHPRAMGPTALFVVGHSLYVIRVGGDWMPFFRFMAPVVPLVAILMARGVSEGLVLARWRPAAVAAAAASLAAAAWMGRRLDGHSIETDVERDKMNTVAILAPVIADDFLPAAYLLNYVVPSGGRLVSDYAGVMSYFTDAEVIDMWGLCNKEIALFGTTEGVNPIWGRTCPACYADLDPEFFHVRSVGAPGQFHDHQSVVAAVWQSKSIGRYVDFEEFVVGRVVDRRRKRAMYFLERRRSDATFETRRPARGIVIEYPFEDALPEERR